ncbi:MAG: type VI secretion system ATPase TssH, partial [Caldilineaceae bacterium]|nr:type VI secretion system ATPase TssH [Caldilineaceae bacterium]
MRVDKLTRKAQEALLEAQSLAEEQNHASLEPEHLLAALLQQEGGVAPAVINKIGVDPNLLLNSVQQALNGKPRATGAGTQVRTSNELGAILREADDIAKAMRDEYTSTEHLLMAMASKGGAIQKLLERHGVSYNGIMQALASVRGNQRVTTDNPESQYEALSK